MAKHLHFLWSGDMKITFIFVAHKDKRGICDQGKTNTLYC